MSGIEFTFFYLFLTSAEASTIASNPSGLSIAVPDKVRAALLIFSFKWPKISVLAVLYQICTFALYGFFLLSRLDGVRIVLINSVPDIELVYTWIVRIQVTVLFLIAMAEEGLYYLCVLRKN